MGFRVGPLRPALAHSQMSLRERMNVRLRGGIQIPAARQFSCWWNYFRLTPLIELVGSTGNAVSYESAIGFGVANPTFLNCLEGL